MYLYYFFQELIQNAYDIGLCDKKCKTFVYPQVVITLILQQLHNELNKTRNPDLVVSKKVESENEDFLHEKSKHLTRIQTIGYDMNDNKYYILPYDSSRLYYSSYEFNDYKNCIIYSFSYDI